MTELSPAAQAVLDAFNEGWNYKDDITEWNVAAALRSAVAHTQQHRGNDVWICDADELLNIADELEALPDA